MKPRIPVALAAAATMAFGVAACGGSEDESTSTSNQAIAVRRPRSSRSPRSPR